MAAYISGVFQDDEKASEMNLTSYNPPRFSPLGINFDTIMHYIDAQLYLYLTVLISQHVVCEFCEPDPVFLRDTSH